MKFLLSALGFSTVLGTVYFKETFDNGLSDKWIASTSKDDYGKFVISAGKFYADEVSSKGLQTSQDAKFYAIAAPFDKEFDNTDKNLVVQFSVKFEQGIDCGGGYVKILPPGQDLSTLHGGSKYNIMFGPDICGSDKKTHLIFSNNDQNHLIRKRIDAESDELTHLYTLILRPDQTYSVLIDNKEVEKGDMISDWDILPPKEINDPKASKPKDWIDEEMMPDPDSKKPEGYDDIPKTIVDPEAVKPEDWDDDMDGDWEAPKIPNPEYKGEWSPKMIKNPDYKGPWVHPKIPNPDYKEDLTLYKFISGAIFFDLWQVKSGTIFDDIIVTDSIEEAKKFAEETFLKKKEAEVAAKKAFDEKEAEKMKAEEEAKKPEESKDENDEPVAENVKVDEDEGHDEL